MNGKVSEFFKEVSKNEKLRKKISEAEKGLGKNLSKEEAKDFFQQKFLPIAKKYGFDFTYEELREYKKVWSQRIGQELDNLLLENVAGGQCNCTKTGSYTGHEGRSCIFADASDDDW